MLRKFAELARWPRIVVVGALVLIVIVNEVGYQRALDATQSLMIEQSRRSALHATLYRIEAAEAARATFALSRSPADLALYTARIKGLGEFAERLRALSAEDAASLPSEAVIATAAANIAQQYEIDSKALPAIEPLVSPGLLAPKSVGAEADELLSAAEQKMSALADERIAVAQVKIDRSFLQFRIGATLAVSLGLASFLLLFRQSDRLDRLARRQRDRLAAERVELEALVLARTARLSVLADHLQRVQENERENLARELHDELGALLTIAKLDIARVKSKLADSDDAPRTRLVHLSETLDAIITLKREIIENLRPSTLSNLGLVASLEILVSEFATNTGISIRSDFEPVELDGDAQLTLYRVVQESLTNIVRYAQARHVQVTLSREDTSVLLTVADDGVGFDFELNRDKSHGIAGMRHRVEALHGEFSLVTNPGSGVEVRVKLPRRR